MLLSLAGRLRAHLGLIRSGERSTAWWVLRNRHFRLYFYGSVISDLGTWLQVPLLSGFCLTFALPARNVTVRRLAADDEVRPAFAMDSVSYNLGRAIAPLMSVALA